MMHELLPDCLMSCLLHMELPGAWDFPGQLVNGQHQWFHRILTVSQHLADLMERRGVPKEKLHAVRWFGYEKELDKDVKSMMRLTVRNELRIGHKQFTVLFPMRLQEQKQPMALPAIAKKLISLGGNPCFVVAGDGPQAARVRRQVEQDKTVSNFRFLGPVQPDNMQALYAASDILCLPSLDEGIPLVYFEAMECCLPIVGSDVGAVSEVVLNGRTGLLIKKGAHRNPENYAEAIRWIMTHSTETQALVKQARQHVRTYSYTQWQTAVASALSDAGLPSSAFVLPRQAPVEKVFIIGAPRTGTTSLGEALTLLGYRNYGFDPYMQELWQHGNYEPIWETIGQHDCFSDGPFNTGDFYKVLAEKYPHAKFILSLRNKQLWKESHQRHFDPAIENQWVKPRFKLHRYEPEVWWRWYDRRNAEIRAFFQTQNRPHHLLEFWVGEEKDPYGKLIGFLGQDAKLPSPLPEFPHLNQGKP